MTGWTRHIALALLSVCAAFACAQVPRITSVTPLRAIGGALVTIAGTGFSTVADENVVWCGAVRASVNSASATTLQIIVPAGASHAPVTVTIAGRTAASPLPFCPSFPSNHTFGPGSLSGRMEYSSISSGPYRVTSGDIDGDGKPDIVIANYQGNSIAVRRNIVDGDSLTADTFSAEADLGTGFLPVGVVLTDVDVDGKLDLVVAHQFSAYISVYLNRSSLGTIVLDGRQDVPVSAGFSSVAVADVSLDGYPDLIIGNRNANSVSVYRNAGSPSAISFLGEESIATGFEPVAVTCGDWDGDGRVDVGFVESAGSAVTFVRNISSGGTASFAPPMSVAVPAGPVGLAAGDLDNDGFLDAVTVSDGTGEISLLRGSGFPGTIAFGARSDIPTVQHPASLTLGDVDGDGYLDAAVASSTVADVFVHRGMITPAPMHFDIGIAFGIATPSLSVALNDLTGNGKPELLAANFSGTSVSVFRNAVLPPPVLDVSPGTLQYPDVRSGDSIALLLTVRNLSPAPLTLSSVTRSTNAFTAVVFPPSVIGGFDSLLIPVRFRPGVFGEYWDTLRLVSDGGNALVELQGTSSFPSFAGLPDSIDFGSAPVFSSNVRTFTATNPSANDLRIDSVIFRTPFGAALSPTFVGPGDSVQATFSYAPQSKGPVFDSVLVFSNGAPAVRKVVVRGSALDVTVVKLGTPWNLVSVPRKITGGDPDTLFPRRNGLMFLYDNLTQNYDPAVVLASGPGYWAKYDVRDTVQFTGSTVDTLLLTASRDGWLLFGSLTHPVPVASVSTQPANAIISPVFRFNPDSQLYEPSAFISPGEGYWVKVDRPCLVLVR
jgi:hypothetical protein